MNSSSYPEMDGSLEFTPMLTPSINDNEYTLVYKFSHNLWEAAGGESSGIAEPDRGEDDKLTLLKKAVSASILL